MAQQFRTGSLPGFTVSAENLQLVLRELRAAEPQLRKELVDEMKEGIKPIGASLLANIPSAPPLSGFSPTVGSSPYVWRKPRMSVRTPLSKRPRKGGTFGVVSIQFDDRRPNAGLSILELAGTTGVGRAKQGLTPAGQAMIRNVSSRYPVRKGLGRFVIPDFKDKKVDATRIAVNILKKYAERVNRRLKGM